MVKTKKWQVPTKSKYNFSNYKTITKIDGW